MPDIERLRELLAYEPETGLLRWLVDRKGRGGVVRAGTVAGHKNKLGYIEVRVDGVLFLGHRIAWALVTGEWPNDEIDHVNSNPSDNRLSNLRLATHGQNGVHKGANRNNKLNIKGVRRHFNRYEARIWRNGKTETIGFFDSPDAASAAYLKVARELHGEFVYA